MPQNTSTSLPFVSPLFGSHMVLQRGVKVPVWGWTTPGDTVHVTINGQVDDAKAGPDGRWEARVGPLEPGGPTTLFITGPKSVAFEDVLIGDVWLCSGQSNMEMGIEGVNDAGKEIAAANYPKIRLFNVEKTIHPVPLKNLKGEWLTCTAENILVGPWGGFSAVGYFFGRDLQKELDVPIGLIQCAWGGTPAEAWTSAEGLKPMARYRHDLRNLSQYAANAGKEDFPKAMAEWYRENEPGSASEPGWGAADKETNGWKTMSLPIRWEQAGLPEFDGVVWFRRDFELPVGAAGKDAILSLGAIDDADVTWVNGVKVGETDGATLPRRYTVAASALKEGRNTIAVRVMDYGGAGGFVSTPGEMALTPSGGTPVSLAGDWLYKDTVNLLTSPPLPRPIRDNAGYPTVLFNGMVAPVVPFGIKGVIWYQGESNAARAYEYRSLMPGMISDWRKQWRQGDFPFLMVQLAAFMDRKPQPSEDSWAELREAQEMTTKRMKNVGMATAVDIGDAVDIHPKNKQEVGRRLALVALAQSYGRKVESHGPEYRSMKAENGTVRITFDHIGGGLLARNETLRGFAVAGEDRQFVWAEARIDGNTVLVSSPSVPKPVAVRYAWDANPDISLYNKAGLPALPFRTDTWPGVTQPGTAD